MLLKCGSIDSGSATASLVELDGASALAEGALPFGIASGCCAQAEVVHDAAIITTHNSTHKMGGAITEQRIDLGFRFPISSSSR